MSVIFSKSDYLKYLQCPSFLWYWKKNPEILSEKKEDPFVERLKAQGYEVEHCARRLYPDAALVNGKPTQAAAQTESLIEDGQKQIFQASFLADGLFSSCDVLEWNELYQGWDIIEVKSSSDKDRKKKEHILDTAFQRIVLMKAGYKVVNVYLLELNKEYYKEGDIDPQSLFNRTEITSDCIELEAKVRAEIEDARAILNKPAPTDCSCKYKGRSNHCFAFNYLYPVVPEYSIYDFRAIGRSQKTLRSLVDAGYQSIADVPEEFKLNEKHERQRWVHVNKQSIIDCGEITRELDKLIYPLYFLDYETLSCGVPKFDKTYPYQQTVFQYSLHIVYGDGKIEHKEYIHKEKDTPVHIIAQKLRADIGDEGHVIVWNKSFEGKCNEDLAKVNPELEAFLLGLNKRIYDLMLIFKRMQYIDDAFKGSYSIKKVLPVLCPELNYEDLDVSNGSEAVVEYENLIFGNVADEDKEKKFKALLEYCKLDTWAMVRIWQELKKVCA